MISMKQSKVVQVMMGCEVGGRDLND